MRIRDAALALPAVCVALASAGAADPRAPAGAAAGVGRAARPFLLERLDGGGDYTLATYRGRPVAINVFAAWCANCRREAPLLARSSARYAGRIAFLGVDEQESASRARAFARRFGLAFPIALDDGQFAATYGTTQIPETIFIDGRGTVRGIRRGLPSDRELDADLASIATARPHARSERM